MATEVLAVGTGDANSSDIVVAVGEPLTVGIKGYNPAAHVVVQLKDDDGDYWKVDDLTPSRPALVLEAGTWRLSRAAGRCGAFSA